MEDDQSPETSLEVEQIVKKKKTLLTKEKEAGIVYLSRIPPYMSVKKIRHIFSQYGELGRVFLQADDKPTWNKKNRMFTEGWIEFVDKKLAKKIALSLNNTQIGGKRRSRWHDELWNIKYLSKFKWGHLNERLAYEREVHKQRLRTEVSQAKKESNFYIENVEKNQRLKKLDKKQKKKQKETGVSGEETSVFGRDWEYTQRETEDEKLQKKRKQDDMESPGKKRKIGGKLEDSKNIADNKSFLRSIFSGGLKNEEGGDS